MATLSNASRRFSKCLWDCFRLTTFFLTGKQKKANLKMPLRDKGASLRRWSLSRRWFLINRRMQTMKTRMIIAVIGLWIGALMRNEEFSVERAK